MEVVECANSYIYENGENFEYKDDTSYPDHDLDACEFDDNDEEQSDTGVGAVERDELTALWDSVSQKMSLMNTNERSGRPEHGFPYAQKTRQTTPTLLAGVLREFHAKNKPQQNYDS